MTRAAKGGRPAQLGGRSAFETDSTHNDKYLETMDEFKSDELEEKELLDQIAELDEQVIKLCFDDPRVAGGGVDSIPAVKAERDARRERLFEIQERRRAAAEEERRRQESERLAASNKPEQAAPPPKPKEPFQRVTVDMMR